jgi:RimJ/RimL family protein N-acetyltransferase
MPFELQPTLRGEHLSLRPLAPGDFPALYAVASDALIWEQHPQPDRYQEPVFRGFFRDALASGGALIVTDNASGAVIGSSRFNAYDEAARTIEIGWTFLARSHWGGSANREMKHLMLTHAAHCVDKVLFVVGSNNRRSQRAVEKLGGVRSGSRLHADGKEDVVFTLVLARYFAATPAKIQRRG